MGNRLGSTQSKILEDIKKDNQITIPTLSKAIGVSTTTIEKHLSKLKENNIISREGTKVSGHWKILIDTKKIKKGTKKEPFFYPFPKISLFQPLF